MQRYVENLKTDWLYIPSDFKKASQPKCPEGKFTRVSLPHTNIELPYHNFSEQEHCFVSWYRRWFEVPRIAKNRRVIVQFDGVMIAATVYVNGKKVDVEHRGGYVPFEYDITDLVKIGRKNLLSVRVDSTERKDIPPFGNVVDYLTFGGIYRDVFLKIVDPIYIKNIFAKPRNVLTDDKSIDITATIVNTTDDEAEVDLKVRIGGIDGAAGDLEVPPNDQASITFTILGLKDAQLWDLDNPTLYDVEVELEDGDLLTTRVGFREAEFRSDGAFYLNGKPLKLRGLNRHQTYPYIGQAGPARLQIRDAEILKYDLACNIVRTSHYPQSPYFLDRCDEIGLLVLEEIPGWQHIGDAEWKKLAVRDVEAMIVRDRNHPSIILWGVRINESPDDHDFYVQTNAVAHQLDPTRQTGGIRDRYDSEFLEDVFTMNEFPYDLRPANHPRYMNTEFCGHMYPTKTFDQEERARQHALHHAHIHNQIGGMKSAGGTGWCAFDYNTHDKFGSGDRICYHGVMDIFREPKLAAYFYASQEDPSKRVVLELGSYWKMGDKSGGGVEPLVVFSNCDEVEVICGKQSRGKFKPSRERYPNLPRPPFVIEKFGFVWGGAWEGLTVIGFIDGEKVAEKKIAPDGIPAKFIVAADDKRLLADGSDMTRVSMRITDAFGNILPFAMQPVMLKISGPGVLVGDNPFPMPGGRGAVYVRSTRKPGTITVTASTQRLKTQTVTIKSVKE